MKYGYQIQIGSTYAVNGQEYNLNQILTFGRGLMYGCRKFVFSPTDKSKPELMAIEWKDGHIDRLKPLIKH